MKKTINKIMCLLAVLVLCLPMLNLCPVSAEELEKENFLLPSYYGIEYFKPHEDGSGFKLLADDVTSSGVCRLRYKNLVTLETGAIAEEEYLSSYCYNSNDVFPLYPYLGIKYSAGYHLLNVADKYSLFVDTLYRCSSTTYTTEEDYYYFTYFFTCTGYGDDEKPGIGCGTFLSTEPIYFSKNDDNTYSINVTEKYGYEVNYYKVTRSDGQHWTSSMGHSKLDSASVYFDENLIPSCDWSDSQIESVYTNCTTMDLSMFSNTDILNYGMSDLKQCTFAEQIDVKLTPEFGLDMDRYDCNGQCDYFKFSITNNSDTSIQWSACIYDPTLIIDENTILSGIYDWSYLCREMYYDSSIEEKKGLFRSTYTYSGVLRTGSFDEHLLKPGETFEDIIYWENVKITENKMYVFNVNAFPTDLDYPTRVINPSTTGDESDLHTVTICEDSYYDTILEYNSLNDFSFGYACLEASVFSTEFSVLSIPAFTTAIRSGNSIINGGSKDAYYQIKNYESTSDVNGTNSKINSSFVDSAVLANSMNRSDVNVNIDSFSIDDVKDYIAACQSFFILIKDALMAFPAFIWALICFGLTGLIVIGVVKALL